MALLGEALAIVVHFFQEDLYKPTQRLIRLEVLAKVLKREELTQRLICCLAVDYNCAIMVVIGGMRDGFRKWGRHEKCEVFLCRSFDVVCFSHTIDNVRSHFEIQGLGSNVRFWIGLFSHSYHAKLGWRERTGQPIRTFSETR